MASSKHLVLILPDIRSAQNVGSLFRTADAAGVAGIYLTGYTPDPVDRFGRPRKDVAKASLGAETWIQWEHMKSLSVLIRNLQKEGYTVVALEQSASSVDYKKFKCKEKTALIVGNEVDGVDKKILKICDAVIEIPMKGKKESLNVSVAAGIALFRILGI